MNKAKVLVTCRLPGNAQDLLQSNFVLSVNNGAPYTYDELFANARGKDAIVTVLVDRIDEGFFESCPRSSLLQTWRLVTTT